MGNGLVSGRRRSYASYAADGEAELRAMLAQIEEGHGCPHCGATIHGLHPVDGPTGAQRAARMAQLKDVTATLQAKLREFVTASTYELWLAPLAVVDVAGDEIHVGAPEEIRTWIGDRFARVLQQAVDATARRPLRVVITTIPLSGRRR